MVCESSNLGSVNLFEEIERESFLVSSLSYLSPFPLSFHFLSSDFLSFDIRSYSLDAFVLSPMIFAA